MNTKRFFFWGIFKNPEVFERRLKVKPKKIKKAKLGKVEGLLYFLDNLSNEEFIQLLGKLALIEMEYYILDLGLVYCIEDKKKYFAYYYIPIYSSYKYKIKFREGHA